MTNEAAAKEIRSRFDTLVARVEELPTEYANAPLSKPPSDSMWLRQTIVWGDSNQVSLGAQKRHRTFGVMMIQLMSPSQSGDGDALELSDKIKKLFRSVTVNGITWRTPSLGTVGRDEQWWVTNVSCPFYFDDLDEV